PPQKLSSLTAAIQQQAQQGRFAGLLRSGKQRHGLVRDDPFPDPGERLRVGLQPLVAKADGGFLVNGHKSSSWKKKGQLKSPEKFERSRPLHSSCSVCVVAQCNPLSIHMYPIPRTARWQGWRRR